MEIIQRNKLKILLACLVALTLAGGVFSFYCLAKLQAKNNEFGELESKLAALQKLFDSQKSELGSLKEKAEHPAACASLKASNDQVEAFAKQAASCDRLKKKLKIKDEA